MWSMIGQTRAVSLLQRSLETDSLAHAYLFVGPAHVGKMTLALNLAQALNCEAAEPPCGQCASCQKIISAKHADVQVIDLSQNKDLTEAENRAKISVDQIEQLQHSASLPPFEGRYRVYIIDGAELLSAGAANRLLKTLEEPLGKIVFILLTINERLVPATVVSRCQRVELLPLAITEVEAALNSNWGIESQKAELLARLSHGCLGWAVDDGLLQQRTERLDKLLDIISGDFEERIAYVVRLTTQFSQNRGLVQEVLDLWLDWWRDLLLVKVGLSDAATNIDRVTTLIDMARNYRLVQIRTFIDSVRAAGEQLKQNTNPRLVLEVLMISIPEAENHNEGQSAAQFEVKYG